MNLYDILEKELEEKSNDWNIIDKLNYIYIRTLQLLSHDSRWKYSNNTNLKNELFDKEVNIFNVEDNRVICSSWSKIYSDLVNILLSNEELFDMSFTEGNIDPHMYTRVFLYTGETIDYDPLNNTDDFLNAKKNLPIKGIRINNKNDSWENDYIIEKSLNKIGYEIDTKNYLINLKELLDIQMASLNEGIRMKV